MGIDSLTKIYNTAHYYFTDKFLLFSRLNASQFHIRQAIKHKLDLYPKHEIYECVQVCIYMLIQNNALFLLAPNYPLLSCMRDQGDAITYFK